MLLQGPNGRRLTEADGGESSDIAVGAERAAIGGGGPGGISIDIANRR